MKLLASDPDEINCVHCDFNCTHQIATVIYERAEDEKDCTITFVGRTFTTIRQGSSELGPSARRHGLRIVLQCEGCHGFTSLNIWQHKGTTFMQREPADAGMVVLMYEHRLAMY